MLLQCRPQVLRLQSVSFTAYWLTMAYQKLLCRTTGQFQSDQFKEYCKSHAIEHIQSPPYHPQSNGQTEKFVDTLKGALLNTKEEGGTEGFMLRFLITCRTSIHPRLNGQSPVEILMRGTMRCSIERCPLNQGSRLIELPSTSVRIYGKEVDCRHHPWPTRELVPVVHEKL